MARNNYQQANIFQFHKGTIKTSLPQKRNKGICNFNSIKVRLKQQGQPLEFQKMR